MKTLTRRDFLKAAGIGSAAVAAFAFAGCAADDESATASVATSEEKQEEAAQRTEEQGVSSDFITTEETATESSYILPKLIVGGTNPDTIPPYSPNMNGRNILYSLYQPMFEQAYCGARASAVLADPSKGGNNPDGIGGFDHEVGSTKYTCYLYENIYDGQGNHITANDVKFCYDNYFAENGGNTWVGCSVVDDYTIELEYKRELYQLLELDGQLGTYIYSQAAYEASSDPFTTTACGTAAYDLVEFVAGSHVEIKKRENFWQTDELTPKNSKANIEVLHVDYIAETAQKVIALQTGAVDMIESLSTEFIDEFQDDVSDRYKVYTFRDNLSHFIAFNCHPDQATSDKNLRLAIAYALNIDGIVQGMGKGYGQRLVGLGNANFPDYNPDWENLDNYNTHVGASDASLVQGYLDAAGYKGEELVIVCNNDDAKKEAEIIQAQAQQYGITLKIASYSGSALNEFLYEPSNWHIKVQQAATKGFIKSLYGGDMFNVSQANANYNGYTSLYLNDEWLNEKCDLMLDVNTTSDDLLEEVRAYQMDNCFTVAFMSPYNNVIIPKSMTSMAMSSKNWIIETACTFEEV